MEVVREESKRLSEREREDEVDNVSIRYARGFGFFLVLKHKDAAVNSSEQDAGRALQAEPGAGEVYSYSRTAAFRKGDASVELREAEGGAVANEELREELRKEVVTANRRAVRGRRGKSGATY